MQNFPIFDEITSDPLYLAGPKVRADIITHLENLSVNFDGYFETCHPNLETWIKCLFTVSLEQFSDNDLAKDELLDLRNNKKLRADFESMELNQFWCKIGQLFSTLTKLAYHVLVPFIITYPAELGFSVLITMKTNPRNKLNVEHDMRVALSMTSPRIELLVGNKQQQPSH